MRDLDFFPSLDFLTMIIVLGIAVFNSDAEANFPWTDLALAPWSIQSSIIARPFILAFAAAIFAVEYEHRTWKIVVPGNRRYVMIISKYLALSAFILLSFFILMVILLIGGMLANLITDSPIEPELTGDTFSEFIGDFALSLSLAFVNTLLLCSLAAFVALFTRSMLFGVLAGVFFVLVEFIGLLLVLALASSLIWEDFGNLYLFTPIYNTDNISSWINFDRGAPSPFDEDISIRYWNRS
ncbi:MAG: hypothetical protein HC919_15805 [Oscillatoriales cyanobacterium SM2_2_1]|nr:hypothetical protein [Oscillatoriales cyanobacterium SM2_2_1]